MNVDGCEWMWMGVNGCVWMRIDEDSFGWMWIDDVWKWVDVDECVDM